jgi:uncharacterized protein YbcI
MPVDGAAPTEPEDRKSGPMSAALSKAIVQLVRDYTGRGPTKVRTSIRDNVVLCLLEDSLTRGEQNLVNAGRIETVLGLRHEYQLALRSQAIAAVELITGRTVTAMMSANNVAPDLAAEIFVLDASPVSDGGDE